MADRKNKINWDKLLSYLLECYLCCTPKGKILFASGPFLGKGVDELQTGTLYEFLPQDVHLEIEDALHVVCQQNSLTQIDLRLPDDKNISFWYHVYFLTHTQSEIIVLWMNMNDRKNTNFSSQAERLKIEQILKIRREILSVMNHEVRTPLTSVISMTELLESLVTVKEQKECVAILKDAVGRLENLISNLFESTRIESTEVTVNKVLFSPLEITKRLMRNYEARAKGKGIGLCCILSEELPMQLRGDEMKIWRICSSLLDNAIKYTEVGEVTVTFDAEYATVKTLVLRFIVQDTGRGIPEEKMKLIFEPFWQEDMSVQRKYTGSGLGLTVVKYLVSVLNGTISLCGNEAGGVTATVTVPTDFVDSEDG
jgi:signal transduction histidine kinase